MALIGIGPTAMISFGVKTQWCIYMHVWYIISTFSVGYINTQYYVYTVLTLSIICIWYQHSVLYVCMVLTISVVYYIICIYGINTQCCTCIYMYGINTQCCIYMGNSTLIGYRWLPIFG